MARLPLEGLQPLDGKPASDTGLIAFRRSPKNCLVSYDGNYYSVPAEYARQTLQVQETEGGELLVLDGQGHEIARRDLVQGRNRRVTVASHFAPLGCGSRPAPRRGAIQVGAPEVESRPLARYDQLLEVGP